MRYLVFFLCVSLSAQSIPLGSTQGSSGCGSPSATNLKGWYSADCMTAISPCATSYTDGHGFTTNQTWLDRSGNNDTLTIDSSELGCVFKVNEINGLPSVSFGGPDSSGNCGWRFGSQPDVGATSWAVFVVFQGITLTSYKGDFVGPNTGVSGEGTFKYWNTNTNEQGLDKSNILFVGQGNTAANTSWNQLNIRFSNQSDQNTLLFRINRTSDGPGSFTSTNINTTNGGIAEVGVSKSNGSYSDALHGRIAELLLYAGTGVIVSSGAVTTNETYLNCRYGL